MPLPFLKLTARRGQKEGYAMVARPQSTHQYLCFTLKKQRRHAGVEFTVIMVRSGKVGTTSLALSKLAKVALLAKILIIAFISAIAAVFFAHRINLTKQELLSQFYLYIPFAISHLSFRPIDCRWIIEASSLVDKPSDCIIHDFCPASVSQIRDALV